jgi:hypothetical protein
VRAFVLKAGATLLTVAAATASALYVTSHLQNPAAPLRPAVANANSLSTVSALGGQLTIGPSVRSSDVRPVTSTYAS